MAGSVVFGGSNTGDMYAMDAETGVIVGSFSTAGSVNSGPSVVGKTILWGSGYTRGGKIPDDKLYRFSPRLGKNLPGFGEN